MNDRPASKTIFFRDSLIGAWVIASQIWYYVRFKPVLEPLYKSVLQKLWH